MSDDKEHNIVIYGDRKITQYFFNIEKEHNIIIYADGKRTQYFFNIEKEHNIVISGDRTLLSVGHPIRDRVPVSAGNVRQLHGTTERGRVSAVSRGVLL